MNPKILRIEIVQIWFTDDKCSLIGVLANWSPLIHSSRLLKRSTLKYLIIVHEILWTLIKNIDVYAYLLVKIEIKLAKVPNNEFKMALLSTWSPVCLLKFRPFPPCMIIPSCMFISTWEMFLPVCLFHPVWLFGT